MVAKILFFLDFSPARPVMAWVGQAAKQLGSQAVSQSKNKKKKTKKNSNLPWPSLQPTQLTMSTLAYVGNSTYSAYFASGAYHADIA